MELPAVSVLVNPIAKAMVLKRLSILLLVFFQIISSIVDKRGHKIPPNKTSEEWISKIKLHIESFPTMESHYCRKDSKKKYLDPTLTILLKCMSYFKIYIKIKIIYQRNMFTGTFFVHITT